MQSSSATPSQPAESRLRRAADRWADTRWGIYLWGSPGPCGPVATNEPCQIGQPPLVVTLPMGPSNVPTGTLELSATVTAARDSVLC